MWVQKVTGAGIDGLAYSPDGLTLYSLDGLGRAVAWNVAARTAEPRGRLGELHRSGIDRLVVSPGGEFLVAVQAGTSVAWSATTNRDYRTADVPWPLLTGFVPGYGSRLAIYHAQHRQVGYWDVEEVREVEDAGFAWYRGEKIRSFAFAPDGRTVAVMGESGEVALTDVSSGEVRTRITVPKRSQWFTCARFAPDGNTLLLFTDHQLVLWDLARGAVRAETREPAGFGPAFALNPRLPVFAALNRDRALTLFGLDTGKAIRSLDFALGRYVTCACFAPDGLTCAVGASNRQFAVFDVDL